MDDEKLAGRVEFGSVLFDPIPRRNNDKVAAERIRSLSAENSRLKNTLAELKSALGLSGDDRTQNGNAQEPDVNVCPGCGGYADNGFSRSLPPVPYYCTKCDEKDSNERV